MKTEITTSNESYPVKIRYRGGSQTISLRQPKKDIKGAVESTCEYDYIDMTKQDAMEFLTFLNQLDLGGEGE